MCIRDSVQGERRASGPRRDRHASLQVSAEDHFSIAVRNGDVAAVRHRGVAARAVGPADHGAEIFILRDAVLVVPGYDRVPEAELLDGCLNRIYLLPSVELRVVVVGAESVVLLGRKYIVLAGEE